MFNYTKKILILSLLASGWSASLQAATGISQKHVNEIRAVMGSLPVQGAQTSVLAAGEDAVTLLDEDFSKFPEGTEAEPDDVNIADNQTGVIPAEYTNVPGWSGAAIYQAGQTCAIRLGLFLDGSSSQPVSLPGVLYTPVGNYAGNGTLTFRAKLLNSTVESDVMAIAMIDANQETAYTELHNKSVTNEWQSYSLDFHEGTFRSSTLAFMMATQEVLIDDIRFVSVPTSIISPTVQAATDFTVDGFTANWLPTQDATSYLLSVYRKKIEDVTVVEGFDGINADENGMIDTASPNYPDGWEIGVTGNGTDGNVSTQDGDYVSGKQALVFDATGDYLVTPNPGEDIVGFSFWAKNLYGQPTTSQMKMLIELADGTRYQIGVIDIERIDSEYGEIIDLSGYLMSGTRRVRLEYTKDANAADAQMLAIDDVSIMTQPEKEYVFEDKPVNETSYVLTGLDEETDYYYTVKATNDKFTSEPSVEVMALGLAAPEALKADNIEDDSFTAQWNYTPKADGYELTVSKVYTAPADEEKVILSEDFENIVVGDSYTFESPKGLNNFSFDGSGKNIDDDINADTKGWMGINNNVIDGMLGASAYFGSAVIQTPALDLSNNEGKFTVELTVYSYEGDSIVVQPGPAVYDRALVTKTWEPVKLVYEFDHGTANMPILIYNYVVSSMFYIDDIKVTQTMPSGAQTTTYVKTIPVRKADILSCDVTDVPKEENTVYTYYVNAYRNYQMSKVYSANSNIVEVDPSGSSVAQEGLAGKTAVYAGDGCIVVDVPLESDVRIFNLSGMQVYAGNAVTGKNYFNMYTTGLYIVKVGNQSYKVMVK